MAGTKKTNSNETKTDQSSTKKGGILPLVLLCAGTTITSFSMVYLLPSSSAEPPQNCTTVDTDHPPTKVTNTEDIRYIALREILITVGNAPADRYLKLNLTLMVDKAYVEAIEMAEPQLLDIFSEYLRAVEVSDFENPVFFSKLRSQLSHRADLIVGQEATRGILITDFLLR